MGAPYIISENKRQTLSSNSGAGLFLYTRRNSRGSYHRAKAGHKQGVGHQKKRGATRQRERGDAQHRKKWGTPPQQRRAKASQQLERQLGANAHSEKNIHTGTPPREK